MSNRVINIKDVISSQSAILRQSARDLFTYISRLPETEITLDFSEIEYASRSFFDELNSKQMQFQLLGKKVEFLNISEAIKPLYSIVQNAAVSKSSMVYTSIASAGVVTI